MLKCQQLLALKIVGILTFISRIDNWLWLFKPEHSIDFDCFNIHEQFQVSCSAAYEKFYSFRASLSADVGGLK